MMLQTYRIVSLTSVYCTSMERILNEDLIDYLENNSLLSDRQFDFRRSRSVEDQILLVYLEVTELVDAGLVVDIAMIELF